MFEADLPRYDLPPALAHVYGGIGFPPRVVYSNFVSSIDGVVTLGSRASSGSTISGRNSADRFLMGLLRACADAVLLGAGTLRATPGHLWTAAHIYPAFADEFAALRRNLGRPPEPRLVLVSASGKLDTSHPAIVAGCTIVTTEQGAQILSGQPSASSDVIVAGQAGSVDIARVIAELRLRQYDTILTEGGPNIMGQLVDQQLLNEAFVTISPVIAGRDDESRLGMVAGREFLPDRGVWATLLSLRRHGDFLFLRYGLR